MNFVWASVVKFEGPIPHMQLRISKLTKNWIINHLYNEPKYWTIEFKHPLTRFTFKFKTLTIYNIKKTKQRKETRTLTNPPYIHWNPFQTCATKFTISPITHHKSKHIQTSVCATHWTTTTRNHSIFFPQQKEQSLKKSSFLSESKNTQ